MSVVREWWRRRWDAWGRLLRRAATEASSPRALALSVALGALIGGSPLVGLHAAVALAAATALRLNRLGALVGTNVSFGPLVAAIAWAEVRVGCAALGVTPLVGGDAVAFARDHVAAWWVGYALVGPALAGVVALVTWALASAWRRRAVSSASARTSAPG